MEKSMSVGNQEAKADAGKIRLTLVPSDLIRAVAKIAFIEEEKTERQKSADIGNSLLTENILYGGKNNEYSCK